MKQIVSEGVQEIVDMLAEFEAIGEAYGDPDADFDKLAAKQARLQEKLDACDGWNLDARLDLAMDALRCPPADKVVDVLSGGERRRVALCRLLLKKPDILLLDEPTNHLDAETVAWLERHLREYEGTVIAVTHDRYFLDNVAGWILELDRGRGHSLEGQLLVVARAESRQLEIEEKGESARAKTLERELEWIGMSAKGRHAKSKARIERYEKLLAEDGKEKLRETKIVFPAGPRLGNVVIEAKGLAKGYEGKLLYEKLSFEVPPGAVVGLIGPNGAGKTTLLRMITGQEKPDAGTIRLGDTVKLAYADQMRTALDPEKTVWEQLSGGLDIIKLGKREVNSRAYCTWFNFSGTDQSKKVGVLSGGERNRLNMAMMVQDCANVLLLDEPTNDLDVNTMRALEEALDDFAGAALVVSHDRWFLDRVCTHILAFEGNSEAIWFDGNFTEFADWRRSQLGSEADRPHQDRV